MGKIAEGTPEWFKDQKRIMVSHARALDCITSARRSVASLIANWENPDPEVRAALHSAAVISYARPFSRNRDDFGKWPSYPVQRLERTRAFDPSLHGHLVDLRNKIIAHHDSEYLSAKLLISSVELSIGAQVPIAVSVHVQSLYSIEDREIAYRYAAHFDAAIECIDAALEHDHSKYFCAVQQWPDVLRSVGEKSREQGGEFDLTDGQPHVIPHAHRTKLGRLPRPELTVGSNGYTYLNTHCYVLPPAGRLNVEGTTGSIEIEVDPISETDFKR
jgi:hypothetical protein